MCGLVGLFDICQRRVVDRDQLRRMSRSIRHRGPDSAGEHLGPGIGLGHRRLAIIDVNGGDQPLYGRSGRIVTVFNGEIYNYKDIARELAAAGHVFRTHSDTEVIIHAWEQWGAASVERFRGMFAFALWDESRQTLFIARDPLGKKPLYYAQSEGWLLFGSELKALMTCPGVVRTLDPCAIEDYFAYGYIPDPRSIYTAVRKLPPAHRLIWRRGEVAPVIEAFWDLPFDRPWSGDLRQAEAELCHRLREATRLRMSSEVPLGAFLSGGVDSSAIVAMMAGLSGDPIKTFSIAFGDRNHDESQYARRLAERYHTDHTSREVTPNDFALFDRLAGIYDEPFGDSSALPTYQVCALARERVTVALSGDGGDEMFGGYRRYALNGKAEILRRLISGYIRAPLFGVLGRLYPKADWAPRWLRAKTTFQELASDSCGAYFQAISVTSDSERAQLFSPAFRRELQGYNAIAVLRRHWERAPIDDILLKAQYVDLKTWLAGGILVKVDRASMANSLEVRSPLLDHTLAEWSAGLRPELKLKVGEGKRVLKRAMEPFVDHELLYRPKRGFSLPLRSWLRGPLRPRIEAVASSPLLADAGIFDQQRLHHLVQQHISGGHDHSATLWLLLMFDAFLVRYYNRVT